MQTTDCKNLDHMCECKSYDCFLEVGIPIDIAVEIMSDGLFVIVDGCPKGPSEDDELIREEAGYKIYKPASNTLLKGA